MNKPLYGGQAVMEGVMMRGKKFVACAVRKPNGDVTTISEPLSAAIYASDWSKIPFLRAVTILWDTLVIGTRMLMFSANIAVVEENESHHKEHKGHEENKESQNPKSEIQRIPASAAWGTLIISLAFGIGLFFVTPLVAVNFVDAYFTLWFGNNAFAAVVSNLFEGAIRLAIFLVYIYSISQIPDVRRVFQYHGAEHKTIAAEEAGAELVPSEIQKYNKEHPRCGTGFLLTVVVVSIFVFALLGRPPLEWRIVSRIVLVPVVAALSYELIKFASARRANPILKWLVVKPSLALQSLTTREPDEKMIEVAVAALKKVQEEEGSRP